MAKRTAEKIREDRDVVGAQIEQLRVRMKELSSELRDVEGPIPDRSNRGIGTTFRIRAAQ